MSDITYQAAPQENSGLHWGHFGMVLATMVLLVGMAWIKNPQLLSLKKSTALAASDPSVPKYYAYVQPADDTVPLVAGASTDQGPVVISDDGSNNVIPVDTGEVLGASTQDVQLTLDDVKIDKILPDSSTNIQKYFSDSAAIETSPIDDAQFETALSSGDQSQIDSQSEKLNAVAQALQKLPVPQSLVTLQKLKLIQYGAAVGILENFTQADQNPQLVGEKLQEFLKSQQDLDDETISVTAKFPNDVPELIKAQADAASQAAATAADNADNSSQNADAAQ